MKMILIERVWILHINTILKTTIRYQANGYVCSTPMAAPFYETARLLHVGAAFIIINLNYRARSYLVEQSGVSMPPQ